MTPRKIQTRPGGRGDARNRRLVAEKYLEVGELTQDESGAAVNVTVGIAVLAGIAAGDAICLAAIGERYSGPDHAAAADLLSRVDAAMGKRLRDLVELKPASHYGSAILTTVDGKRAMRNAAALVIEAQKRTM
ncbi:hypothetical protein Xcel_2885 [Xylanimonas cellulosilytica DSM 15894]|uniref:Uncharacterized protein n=1 Tax=Xylanimonas cellulosilytica (strain DSM 15894 / JCM 12276 / CECT 5975 / KCTC 9989 / LMG 20990 / NBRC 107835 / XIL07) TaxID=446471 RepID=D1BYM5_XYLCX|nr:hypothetical protein [Xylanimonas cellulosilytica]ACZ31897.1 hypothetical protein Xcel_2885 [Xylanimonas cellulosilytica DSM 15894]